MDTKSNLKPNLGQKLNNLHQNSNNNQNLNNLNIQNSLKSKSFEKLENENVEIVVGTGEGQILILKETRFGFETTKTFLLGEVAQSFAEAENGILAGFQSGKVAVLEVLGEAEAAKRGVKGDEVVEE